MPPKTKRARQSLEAAAAKGGDVLKKARSDLEPESSMELSINDLGSVLTAVLKASIKWYNIGLMLKVAVPKLDRIRSQFNDPADGLREMLKAWFETAAKQTWQDIVDALRKDTVGNSNLASDIEAKHCTTAETGQASAHMIPEVHMLQQELQDEENQHTINDSEAQVQEQLQMTQEKFLQHEQTIEELQEGQWQIQELAHQVEENQHTIHESEAQVQELNQQLQSTGEKFLQHEQTIEELQESQRQIQELTHQVEENQHTINDSDAQVQEKFLQHEQAIEELLENQRQIQELTHQVEENEAQVQELNQQLQATEEKFLQQEQTIGELRAAIVRLRQELQQAVNDKQSGQRQLQELIQQLQRPK